MIKKKDNLQKEPVKVIKLQLSYLIVAMLEGGRQIVLSSRGCYLDKIL